MDIKCVNDIEIVGGDIALVQEPDASGQRVRHRLMTFKAEWFLDLNFGPPYREQIFVKNPRIEIVGSVIRSEIAKSITGTFTRFDASLNQTTRRLSVVTTIETRQGATTVELTI